MVTVENILPTLTDLIILLFGTFAFFSCQFVLIFVSPLVP